MPANARRDRKGGPDARRRLFSVRGPSGDGGSGWVVVRQIIKYEWEADWRRFTRSGQLPRFDALLLLLLGALFIFKLLPVLRSAALELAIGQTAVMDQRLFAIAAAWLYPWID